MEIEIYFNFPGGYSMVDIEWAETEKGRVYCKNPRYFVNKCKLMGKSQQEIAKIAGVDPSTVRGWVARGFSSAKPIEKLRDFLISCESKSSYEQSTELMNLSDQSVVLKEERIEELVRVIYELIKPLKPSDQSDVIIEVQKKIIFE